MTPPTDLDRAFALGLIDGSVPKPAVPYITDRVARAIAEARTEGYAKGYEDGSREAAAYIRDTGDQL